MLSSCYAVKVMAVSIAFFVQLPSTSSLANSLQCDARTAQRGNGVGDTQQIVHDEKGVTLEDANALLTSINSELLIKIEALNYALEAQNTESPSLMPVLANSDTDCVNGSFQKVSTPSSENEYRLASGGMHTRNGVLRDRPLAPGDPALALSLSDVALALHHRGQYQQAEEYFTWALGILQSDSNTHHLSTATALKNLADHYLDTEKYSKAAYYYHSALSDYRSAFGDEHPKMAAIQNKLAASFRGQGRFIKAADLYRKSIKTYEAVLGREHPHLVAPLNNMAKLYIEMSRYDEAEGCLSRAMSIVNGSRSAAPYRDYIKESMVRLAASRASDAKARENGIE